MGATSSITASGRFASPEAVAVVAS
jgi:hypothetical protein